MLKTCVYGAIVYKVMIGAVAAVTTSVNENPNLQLILNETCGGDEERT